MMTGLFRRACAGVLFVSALLTHASFAQTETGGALQQTIESQIQTVQDDSSRTCVTVFEQKLSELVDRAKIARNNSAWTADVPKDVEKDVVALRATIPRCALLRSLTLAPTKPGRSALEDILNSPNIRFAAGSGKPLKLEVMIEADRKDPEPIRPAPRQLEPIAERLDALNTKMDRLDKLIRDEPKNYLGYTFGFVLAALTFMCLMGVVGLALLSNGSNRKISGELNTVGMLLADILRHSTLSRLTEKQEGVVDRGRTYTRPESISEFDRASRAQGPKNSAYNWKGEAKPLPPDPAVLAQQAWERDSQKLLKMVRASMTSFEAFEALAGNYQIIALDRNHSAVTTSDCGLRLSAGTAEKAQFWAVEVQQHLLLFPGRHLYSIASTLADARGQSAIQLFSGLFKIEWDASDLRIEKPANIAKDGHGGFSVQELGLVRLFLREA